MAWPNFSLSDLYTAVITNLNSRLQDTGKLFNGVTTTGAEFTDQVKYNSSTKRLERWNGSAWVALDLTATTVDLSGKATLAVNSDATGTVPKTTENGMRVIRGNVNADGTIAQGSGFTVAATSTGVRTITYSSAFVATPTVTSTTNDNSLTKISSMNSSSGTTSVIVTTIDPTTGFKANSAFSFIAIGPN